MRNYKKHKKEIIRLLIIMILTTLGSYFVSFKFISEKEIKNIMGEHIFSYSYLITFLLTTIGVLITLITFIYTMFNKFLEDIHQIFEKYEIKKIKDREHIEKSIQYSFSEITKELSDNIKLILVLLVIVFAHFIGYYSNINQKLIFSDVFVLAFEIEVYILTILSIMDTVITLLKLLQHGLIGNNYNKN